MRLLVDDEACSVCDVTRFVVDCETLLRIVAGETEVAAQHKLVAPTLVRLAGAGGAVRGGPPG